MLFLKSKQSLTIAYFTALMLVLGSCKPKETDVVAATCATAITNFTVSQQSSNLNISVASASAPLYYEISVVFASGTPDPNTGTKFTVTGQSASLSLDSLNIAPSGNYVCFARAICADLTQGAWSTGKVITFTDFCSKPTNLAFTSGFLSWQKPFRTTPSLYQVEYGLQGFTLGTGAIATSNTTNFPNAALMAGKTYEFYVKSFCTTTNGWSDWTGPLRFASTMNQNLCLVPSNTVFSVERNISGAAVGAIVRWNANGEQNFEFVIVLSGRALSSGTVYSTASPMTPLISLTQSTDYDFYVRAACVNGNKTAWLGPSVVNIGR